MRPAGQAGRERAGVGVLGSVSAGRVGRCGSGPRGSGGRPSGRVERGMWSPRGAARGAPGRRPGAGGMCGRVRVRRRVAERWPKAGRSGKGSSLPFFTAASRILWFHTYQPPVMCSYFVHVREGAGDERR